MGPFAVSPLWQCLQFFVDGRKDKKTQSEFKKIPEYDGMVTKMFEFFLNVIVFLFKIECVFEAIYNEFITPAVCENFIHHVIFIFKVVLIFEVTFF